MTTVGTPSVRVGTLRRLAVRSRPRFWLYLGGPALVGAVYAAGSVEALLAPLPVALVAYFLLPANLLLYGVNDVFDADVDRHNPKKEGERETRWAGDRATVVGVAVAGLLGLALVPALPAAAVAWLAAFYLLAVGYSAPPLRLKTRPPLDSVSNGLYVLPGVVAFVALAGAPPPALAVAGGWLWTMGMHTFSAIPDVEPDRRAGIRTTATVLGESRSYAYVGGCWLAAAACFAALDSRLGVVLAVYPLLVVGVVVTDVAVDRAYWWFPAVNGAVGMALTLGGLWRLLYG